MAEVREFLSAPQTWVRVHGFLAVVWILMAVPAVLWWRDSVPFLVFISVYANFAGSVASWTAARADQNSPTCEDVARLEAKLDAAMGRLTLLTARGR